MRGSPKGEECAKTGGRRPATGGDHTKYHHLAHFELCQMDVLRSDQLILVHEKNGVLWASQRISFDENTTSSAGERSRFTNAMLSANLTISFDENSTSDAEVSQSLQIECFLRF